MPPPKNLGELEDVIYLSSWLGASIPKLTEVRDKFHVLAEKLKKGFRTGRAKKPSRKFRYSIILTDKDWTEDMNGIFTNFKEWIAQASKVNFTNYS